MRLRRSVLEFELFGKAVCPCGNAAPDVLELTLAPLLCWLPLDVVSLMVAMIRRSLHRHSLRMEFNAGLGGALLIAEISCVRRIAFLRRIDRSETPCPLAGSWHFNSPNRRELRPEKFGASESLDYFAWVVCRAFCPATQCLKLLPKKTSPPPYATFNSSIFNPSALSRSIIACRAYSDEVVILLSAAAEIAAGRRSGARIRKKLGNRTGRGSLI